MPKIDELRHIAAREGVNDQFVFGDRSCPAERVYDLLAMKILRWIYELPNAHDIERHVREWSVRKGIGKTLPAPDDILDGALYATQMLEPAEAINGN